ncbi:hypothetical protein P154DRAFT_607042 [Amniculicola lignicola CBS 123094]|uniref:Cyanovirin-N domain-containing protein n=1 Tax=Amniculicola lignicola CBS 123094 TaxID=1392246 RepID=A0A6A5WAI3_9PLEO|nr:hypothetical protein P154DRAFT_607042 [Amniculicola lignicola CBS 123094]
MAFLLPLAALAALFIPSAQAQENCYRVKHPTKSSCAAPNLWAMRETICSSAADWGQGFRFLSGHGYALHIHDNCTADNNPDGIDLYMTVSSTVQNHTDCYARTKSIIERCVVNGYPEFNGGEWWDLNGEDDAKKDGGNGKTFMWMQYLHDDPPPVPNPCYDEYPPPDYCPPYYPEVGKVRREMKEKRLEMAEMKRRVVERRGLHVEMDTEGRVLGRRFVHEDGRVEELV